MKILVIDDTQKHLDAAVATLSGHELTLCLSYDEALSLLERKYDEEKRSELYRKYCEEEGVKYSSAASSRAEEESRLPYWDVVLCDLLMPVGEHTHGQKKRSWVGEELPFGFGLSLTAVRGGAKYVLVLTDACHHGHPASAMLDTLDHEGRDPHIFNIDGAKVLMTNFIHHFEFEGEEEEIECYSCHNNKAKRHCSLCNGTGETINKEECFCVKQYKCKTCNNTGKLTVQKKGKHWGKLLDRLLA